MTRNIERAPRLKTYCPSGGSWPGGQPSYMRFLRSVGSRIRPSRSSTKLCEYLKSSGRHARFAPIKLGFFESFNCESACSVASAQPPARPSTLSRAPSTSTSTGAERVRTLLSPRASAVPTDGALSPIWSVAPRGVSGEIRCAIPSHGSSATAVAGEGVDVSVCQSREGVSREGASGAGGIAVR